jgi:hypothetical protein
MVTSTTTARSKYRIFPSHTPQERESLKASIAERGVDVLGITDQDGNLLDGWERDGICTELGIPFPLEIRHFASEAEKFELIVSVNAKRRQLNRQQTRNLIAAYLRADPAIADNYLASLIGGVSKNTVAEVRRELEATCQIDKLTKFRGRDGKSRPRKYARVIASTPRDLDIAKTIIGSLPPQDKILDATTAARHARRQQRKQEIESQIPVPLPDGAIRLYHCPFQQLEAVAGIASGSADVVLTDIPYGAEFLPQLPDLGAFAERILVEGGLFVMYSGQYYLDQVMTELARHLTYRWMMASVWDGDGTLAHTRNVLSKWKPILVYSKGHWQERGMWVDLLRVPSKEKDWHPWQQPLEEVERLVRYFSKPGDLVVDPCGGGFTTAVACQIHGRRCISCDVDEQAVLRGAERLAQVYKL